MTAKTIILSVTTADPAVLPKLAAILEHESFELTVFHGVRKVTFEAVEVGDGEHVVAAPRPPRAVPMRRRAPPTAKSVALASNGHAKAGSRVQEREHHRAKEWEAMGMVVEKVTNQSGAFLRYRINIPATLRTLGITRAQLMAETPMIGSQRHVLKTSMLRQEAARQAVRTRTTNGTDTAREHVIAR